MVCFDHLHFCTKVWLFNVVDKILEPTLLVSKRSIIARLSWAHIFIYLEQVHNHAPRASHYRPCTCIPAWLITSSVSAGPSLPSLLLTLCMHAPCDLCVYMSVCRQGKGRVKLNPFTPSSPVEGKHRCL